MIKIICVGKKHETIYAPAIEYFEQKLKHHVKLTWCLLPHSTLSKGDAVRDESSRILTTIERDDFVLLFDEYGDALTSPQLAELVNRAQYSSQNISIVIGGSYGVDDRVKERASASLSLGRVVFPHQLMLYRAYAINSGSSYHHS
jgi:23S rRNA (pseudouridine1915-N3)-methyltransferase